MTLLESDDQLHIGRQPQAHEPRKRRIGLREVKSLAPGEILWDTAVIGFYARRQRSAAVTYGLKYRTTAGQQRWATIGRHGSPWTPESARTEARRLLGQVAHGQDPSKNNQSLRAEKTVAELCADYLSDAEAGKILTRRGETKRRSTLTTDRSRIAAHIIPLLGSRKVSSVTTEDVEAFMHDIVSGKAARRQKLARRAVSNIRGGRGAAARTVGLLGAIFTYAVRRKMRADNPVRGVIRPADGQRNRRLSQEEYASLGLGLASKDIWPHAVAAARLLAVTGWRTGEVIGLRWREVDLQRRTVSLTSTKTGGSLRPLSRAAVRILERQHEVAAATDPAALVFPASRGQGAMTGFPRMFAAIAKGDGLPQDVTPHVLRHSFASIAADLGFSEPTIAALVGHKGGTVTRRYIHTADAVLLAAADAVADTITRLLSGPFKGETI